MNFREKPPTGILRLICGVLLGIAFGASASAFVVNRIYARAWRDYTSTHLLDVQMPSSGNAQPLTVKPKEIFLNINAAGEFTVDGVTKTAAELETFLMQAGRNNPVSQAVIIRADKAVPLDAAVKVMELCNNARITDYQITTAGEPQ